ncbi:unnamed protein product [Mytilus coruscus]|uniref:Uncharacterized protein n=1 Tax=Mytilus coruscus TaxID=42192 RepID=A0A6J8C4S4_MYTCO|nr:unnamed protein product [Mytilus coruscus]
MMKIHNSTGIVLAIGTPICSNCRKHLSSGKPDEHLEVSVPSEEIPVEPLSEIDYDKNLALNIDGEKREYKRYSSDSCKKIWNDHQKETVTDGGSQTESESMCFETGDSQYSEASVCMMDKLQRLNSFLATSDVSPVKEKLIPLLSSTDKTKQRCVSKALQCMSAICETICPGEGDSLKDLLFKSVFSAHKPEKSSTLDETALILKDTYNTAETWTLRRQILSVLSRNYSFDMIREMIPDLTKYRFYAAKQHSDEVGCGLPVSRERLTRNKIDIAELEHFIDFIISSDVVKDLPFGMKTMKLTSGEIVNVPNLIRSLAPSSLVNQYIQFCDSENVGHLEKLCASSEKKKELKSKLLNGKRYIKSDFKISQDGSVTASVLCDVVHDLTKQVPNIQEVNFFSDNAGCYKNTMMMVALRAELGDKLKTYNFSEAQDGKGPCDRRASHIKACVRRYINEGHDVTSAEEMKQKMVINKYIIFVGKRISWDNIGTTEQRTNLLVKVDWTIAAPQLLEEEVMAQEEELIEPNPKKQKKNSINQPYDLLKDGCTRALKLNVHWSNTSLLVIVIITMKKQLKIKQNQCMGKRLILCFHGTRVQLDCNFNDCSTSESVKGWALKGKRKEQFFSQSQVNYMKEKFDIGKVSEEKLIHFKQLMR